jgi:hypothetical protein
VAPLLDHTGQGFGQGCRTGQSYQLLLGRRNNQSSTTVGFGPKELCMSQVQPFHSVNEIKKPQAQRVHHNNNVCPPGRDIPQWERQAGTGSYRLCDDCQKYNREGR